MTAHKKPIDHRPFRSRTEHLLEKSLAAQYRGLAIPEVVAALVPGNQRGRDATAKNLAD